jgi:hypothetical protein
VDFVAAQVYKILIDHGLQKTFRRKFMALPVSSQSLTISACHRVLQMKDLDKKIFTCLLAQQIEATRNLKEMKIEEKDPSLSKGGEIRLGKEEKDLLAAKALKEGTRNMEVVRSVCKQWNAIILGNKEFHFFLIFTRVKRVMAEQVRFFRGKECPYGFHEILRIEALGDPEGVTSTYINFPTVSFNDMTLLEYIKDAVSRNKLSSAKAMANVVKKPREKILALCEIAKIEPQAIQEAKILFHQMNRKPVDLFHEIAKVEALNGNFDAAISLLNVRGEEYEGVLIDIAKAAAKYNPRDVKNWASKIKNPEIQALVQFEVAIIEGDSMSASEWLSQFEKIPVEITADRYFKIVKLANSYIKLAKLDKSLGYVKAKECISSLNHGLKKVELLIELAELDEKPNFAEAKQEASLAPFPSYDFHKGGDYKIAFEHGGQGGDEQFSKITLAEARHNVDAALVTANKIVNSACRMKRKLDIELIRGDINAVKAVIMQTRSADQLALEFIEVARQDPLHDLTEAKASIRFIYSVLDKIPAICKIAEMVLEFPLDCYELRPDRLVSLSKQRREATLL